MYPSVCFSTSGCQAENRPKEWKISEAKTKKVQEVGAWTPQTYSHTRMIRLEINRHFQRCCRCAASDLILRSWNSASVSYGVSLYAECDSATVYRVCFQRCSCAGRGAEHQMGTSGSLDFSWGHFTGSSLCIRWAESLKEGKSSLLVSELGLGTVSDLSAEVQYGYPMSMHFLLSSYFSTLIYFNWTVPIVK